MLKVEVGQRLKEARLSAGYTQKQVAEQMGTVQTAYIGQVGIRLRQDGLFVQAVRRVGGLFIRHRRRKRTAYQQRNEQF